MIRLGDINDELEDTLGNGEPISNVFNFGAGIGTLGTTVTKSQRAVSRVVSSGVSSGGSSGGGSSGGGGGRPYPQRNYAV